MQGIKADVLVVGGGGAACRAAIEAHDAGARVVLATKGRLGMGGATGYRAADYAGLAIADNAVDPTDTPDLHREDILRAGLGMCDEELVQVLVEEGLSAIPDLESWGVDFERDEQGNYLITQACFSSRPRNYKLKGHGQKIVAALARQIRARRITVLEQTMLVDLLTRENRVAGAVLLGEDGRETLVRAAAVVLGTGGAGQLFEFNLNPPDITGDSYAVGLRAGAELINLEFVQYGIGTLPATTVLAFWLWPFLPILTNGLGKEFLAEYLPNGLSAEECMQVHGSHFPFSNRLLSRHLEMAIVREIRSGRTSPHGGIYADFTGRLTEREDLPDTTRKLWRNTREWFRSLGLRMDEAPIEVALFAHAMNGGLRVDANGESGVRGLFAVGEAAGGPHGADRLGGGMLTSCQVFGRRAGRAAAAHGAQPGPEVCADQVAACTALLARLKRGGTQSGQALRARLQRGSTEHLLLLRTQSGLQSYANELEELERLFAQGLRIEHPRDLIEAAELRNLILTGKAMAAAALERRETRGGHIREDHPQMDREARWMVVSLDEKQTLRVRPERPNRIAEREVV